MIQLTFQAALDPFHTVFRFFRLRSYLANREQLPYDKLRILDFYLVFPFRITEIRLNRGHQNYKKLAAIYGDQKPYGDLPDSQVIFERMGPIQAAAIRNMVSKGYYEAGAFEHNLIVRTSQSMPEGMAKRVNEINDAQKDLMDFLSILDRDYELSGVNGLKARTGLIEYRYDPV